MTHYKEITPDLGNASLIVRTDADEKEWFIPKDETNSDYQRYLRWLENPDAEENGTIS